MRNGLRFLLKTILIALALFACRPWLQPAYQQVVLWFALRFLNMSALTLYVDSLDKIIPFAALLFATPRMPWPRKAAMLAIGVVVFLVIDVCALKFSTPTNIAQTGVYNTRPDDTFFWLWEAYGRWLLPLLLWLLASYRYLDGLFNIGHGEQANPASADEVISGR